jgi:exoribonuclease II
MSPIRQQLLDAIEHTPDRHLEPVLTFLNNLIQSNDRSTLDAPRLSDYDEKIHQWETLSDNIAHQLRDEFADEDRAIAQLSVLNFAQFAQTTDT